MRLVRFLALGLLLALTGLPLAPLPVAQAATFTVNTFYLDRDDANPGDAVCDADADAAGLQCTLRAAISETNALPTADTITVPEGTITLTLAGAGEGDNATGDLDITDDLTINGTGTSRPIVDGNDLDRVLYIGPGATVTINHLAIQNGRTPDDVPSLAKRGGGLLSNGIVTLNDVYIASNETGDGQDGSDGGGGAGIYNIEQMTVNDSIVTGNRTGKGGNKPDGTGGDGGDGGGIYNIGTLTLNNTTVRLNGCGAGGSGRQGGRGGHGGGIYNEAAGRPAVTTLNDSSVSLNASGGGGNSGSTYAGGSAGSGGGIYNRSSQVIVNNSRLTFNITGDGGDATTAQGGIGGHGGNIYNHQDGDLALHNSTLDKGSTGQGGSGATKGSRGSGGGIHASGDVALTNSTLSDNEGGAGGGILAYSGVQMTLSFCTIADNTASYDGGGIFQFSSTVEISNTIIADNTDGAGWGPDCKGTLISQNYNMLEDTTGCTFATGTGDITGQDPHLEALADNGGPTPTHALQAISLAINRIPDGENGCQGGVSTDQRGRVRAGGGPGIGDEDCEIGAYEYNSEVRVQFSSANYSVEEDAGAATITVVLNQATADPVTADYGTPLGVNGAATPGEDYTETNGTLTFQPGDTSETFAVPILDDEDDEGAEVVSLVLGNPNNAELGTPREAKLTIRDLEDAPVVQFSSRQYTVDERAGTATIAVTLSAASNRLVDVHYATSDGTAQAGSDYTAANGPLPFYPGDTRKTFTVVIRDDDREEGHETVNLALSDPSNARLGSRNTATLTILDDETPMRLYLPLVMRRG